VFNRAVIGPGLLMTAQMATYGVVASFVPILAARRGLDNPGLFFLVYAAAIFVAQTVAGRASDRLGRMAVVLPGLIVSAIGLAAIAAVGGWWLLVAGAVYGVGAGMVQPALFAAGGDRVPATERGSAMATMGLFLEIGIGGGSVVAGLVAGTLGLATTFALVAALPALAAIGASVGLRSNSRSAAVSPR
jgi:MFS family permease